MARESCVSTSPPMASTPVRICSISASNCLCVCSFMFASPRRSTEAPGDVVLGFLAPGLEEELVRVPELDQLAEIHVGGVVGDARRLLHVMGHDGNRIVFLQLEDELLD